MEQLKEFQQRLLDLFSGIIADPALLFALLLGLACLVTAICSLRMAGLSGRSRMLWGIVGLLPIFGQVAMAYLASQPNRLVLNRLDMIHDFLVRGIPPEQLDPLINKSSNSS